MDSVRKFFTDLGCRCCFLSEIPITDTLQAEDKSNLDISSQQIPKLQNPTAKNETILNLVIVESEKLQVGKIFAISPEGLKNSDRTNAGDGCVYAGSLYYEQDKIVNDVVLPQSEKGVGKRHFMIQNKQDAYFLKDLGDGMGTFIRLNKPLRLKSNYIISFGDSHMIVVIENLPPPRLVIKFIDGPKVDQKL
jgi:hypothetical protein